LLKKNETTEEEVGPILLEVADSLSKIASSALGLIYRFLVEQKVMKCSHHRMRIFEGWHERMLSVRFFLPIPSQKATCILSDRDSMTQTQGILMSLIFVAIIWNHQLILEVCHFCVPASQ
jgi:hypothetical protein